MRSPALTSNEITPTHATQYTKVSFVQAAPYELSTTCSIARAHTSTRLGAPTHLPHLQATAPTERQGEIQFRLTPPPAPPSVPALDTVLTLVS